MTWQRRLVIVGIVAYVWIIMLAYVRVWVPEHTSFSKRWTQCMTEERNYYVCIKSVH